MMWRSFLLKTIVVFLSSATFADILVSTEIDTMDLELVNVHGTDGSAIPGNFQYVAARFDLPSDAIVEEISSYLAVSSSPSARLTYRITRNNGSGLPDSGTLIYGKVVTLDSLCCFDWRGLSDLNLELLAGSYWISIKADALESTSVAFGVGVPQPLPAYARWSQETSGWEIADTGYDFSLRVEGAFTVIEDVDHDGVNNEDDNCIYEQNQGQQDSDTDGYGNRCDADFDNNCIANFLDYAPMVQAIFTTDPDSIFDMDSNGNVSFLDYGLFYNHFFRRPGPSGLTNTCTSQ